MRDPLPSLAGTTVTGLGGAAFDGRSEDVTSLAKLPTPTASPPKQSTGVNGRLAVNLGTAGRRSLHRLPRRRLLRQHRHESAFRFTGE